LTKRLRTETGNAAKRREARESGGKGVNRIEDAASNVPSSGSERDRCFVEN
jgi:hypothetical protein